MCRPFRAWRFLAAALAVASACGPAAAQDFTLLIADVFGGRQVFETRLGGTSRVPPSGQDGAGLLNVVLIAGPTPGTTALRGAFLDGTTMFTGGGSPPGFGNILTSGAAYSLGGGCQFGGSTYFPFINGSRPQIVQFNAATGAFSVTAPTIPGNDQFDAIDCASGPNGILYVLSNRTNDSLIVYRDPITNLPPLQTLAPGTHKTPSEGGLRPVISVAIDRINGDAFADIAYMTTDGVTRVTELATSTGAVGVSCPISNSTPPATFVIPRETAIAAGDAGRRIVIGDFNLDAVADIAMADLNCNVQITQGPPGSAAGGSGYNWNGYAAPPVPTGTSLSLLWGSNFYLQHTQTVAQPAPFPSPFVGRGGPFHGCATIERDLGPSYIATGIGLNSTQVQYAIPLRLLPQDNTIHASSLEDRFKISRNCYLPLITR